MVRGEVACWCPMFDRSYRHPIITAATPEGPPAHGVSWHWSPVCPPDRMADAMFVHSRPLPTWGRPAVFHLEEARSLFWGKVESGNNPALTDALIEAVRAELSEYAFIVTHLRHTAETLCDVLQAPELAGRIIHCPLGIEPPKGTSPKPADRTRFLFTNSFHNDPANLKRRGLREVWAAYAEIRKYHAPFVELVVVAPGVPAGSLPPGVTWIDRRVSDESMDELFASSHALLLPAIDLHAHSVVRAQANGCIPIVSDAPGFEEFVEHQGTGLVVEGWNHPGVSWRDETGLHRSTASLDDREGFEGRVRGVAAAMTSVILGSNTRDLAVDALARHSITRWRETIANAVRYAVEGS